jgi:Zn-dependent protease
MNYDSFLVMLTYLFAYLVCWTFALTAQLSATAWMANYFGDDTAKNAGRISLSPFVQLDLLGSIILPSIMFIIGWYSTGIPFIAWGKVLPFEWEKIGKSGRGFIAVNLSSTAVSLLIAVCAVLVLKLSFALGWSNEVAFVQTIAHKDFGAQVSWLSPIELMLWYSVAINLALAILSLTPIPPLAGGAILNSFIKDRFPTISTFFTRFGLLLSLAFLFFITVPYILSPILIKVLQFIGLS